MPTFNQKINTAIIDDEEEYLFDLKEHLTLFPEIEMVGFTTKYKQAKSILQNNQLDLVFMDIEMPVKNGFELLNELRAAGPVNFSVIFYTAYDKYVIQALREKALDYLLKPLRTNELKNAIERFKTHILSPKKTLLAGKKPTIGEIISLPAPTGIRFMGKDNILLFQCTSDGILDKKYWTALLADRNQIKLRNGITAKDILDFVGTAEFVRVNPTHIVNVNYLSTIEFKTRECQLLAPFNDINIVASRSNMTEIRDKFDLM